MSSVLQPWVMDLPWKQQSVLLSGLRGPDGAHCPTIKQVTRWLRGIVQNNADPSHSYMMWPQKPPSLNDLEKELEYVSVHYLHHLSQALKVVSIGAPRESDAVYARIIYRHIATEILHLMPEADKMFKNRLRDQVEHD